MAATRKEFIVREGQRIAAGDPARWYDAGAIVKMTNAEARPFIKRKNVELYDADVFEGEDEDPADSEPDTSYE
jgi:hypothetical protein